MARKKQEAPAVEPTPLVIQPGEDRSPEGGYDGPDSETEAAKASMLEDLTAPTLDSNPADEGEE